MAGYDYRTNPRELGALSFYIFDNLRCNQDREGGNVHRFDTVQEAVAVFKYISAEHPTWTTALGGSIFGTSEVDFVQRRMGANALVMDYKNMEYWKDNPDAQRAIDAAAQGLNVEWQLDNSITKNSIMVPYEPDEAPLDAYFARMELRPTDPDNPLTSIQEAYVQGHGWLSLQELQAASRAFGYHNPERPKMPRLNVAYAAESPSGSRRTGYVDMAPSDFRQMQAAYVASREREAGAQAKGTGKSVEDLAKEAKTVQPRRASSAPRSQRQPNRRIWRGREVPSAIARNRVVSHRRRSKGETCCQNQEPYSTLK